MEQTQRLAGRTILLSPDACAELTTKLEGLRARVIAWSKPEIGKPEDSAALDEAIENLFGYDWLVFRNVNAAEFFLARFLERGHEVAALDALRVCAIGDATVRKLEESKVHVDLSPDRPAGESVFRAIEDYVGGSDSLRGLNFLIPRATFVHDRLSEALQEAGARVDLVAAYRTTASPRELAQLQALLSGGGIDGVVFTSSSDVRNFAELFDTADIADFLRGVGVACINDAAVQTGVDYGLQTEIITDAVTTSALATAIVEGLG